MYAHETSLVGSIGVISGVAATGNVLNKNRIVRHEVTTSENLLEAKFDPIGKMEISDEMVDTVKSMQAEIFVSFSDHVLKHRKDKFAEADMAQIFSADVALGEESKRLGLIDEIGTLEETI